MTPPSSIRAIPPSWAPAGAARPITPSPSVSAASTRRHMRRVYRRSCGSARSATEREGLPDEPRPRLEPLRPRHHLAARHEPPDELVALPDRDRPPGRLDAEHDAEVHGADLVRV